MRLILIALMALFLVSCKEEAVAESKAQESFKDPRYSLWVESKDGDRRDFTVELAITPKQQAQGLMGRTELKKQHGMLFVFGNEADRFFWMKNTLIPLDMIFIKKDGTIHRIYSNALPNDMSTVQSQGPVSAVLEINGGEATRLGIEEGDIVHHSIFMN